MQTTNSIRESFISFFEKKSHKQVNSSSVISKDDPSLMFVNAGMNQFKDIMQITYLDADLLFYSSPNKIFKEIDNSSIAIIEHRFSPPFKNLEINGRFCVEWNSFRRDKEGMECLENWKNHSTL